MRNFVDRTNPVKVLVRARILPSILAGMALILTGTAAKTSAQDRLDVQRFDGWVQGLFGWEAEFTSVWIYSDGSSLPNGFGDFLAPPHNHPDYVGRQGQFFTAAHPDEIAQAEIAYPWLDFVRLSSNLGSGAFTHWRVVYVGSGAGNQLSVSPTSRSIEASGGSFAFSVSSDISWSWSKSASWITSGEASPQSNNQTFSYTVAPNTSSSSRTATITLSGGGRTATHTINQAGTAPPSQLSVDPASRNATKDGGGFSFSVNSNLTWTWTSIAAWVTSAEPATQSGNQTFSYTLAPNPGLTERTATITLTGGGLAATHTITQAAGTGGGGPFPPSVTTTGVTDITSSSAIANGLVQNDGGAQITERGIVHSTTGNPGIGTPGTTRTPDGSTGVGTFSVPLQSLTPGTTYHFKAYAINSAGTAYGSEMTFTTPISNTLTDSFNPGSDGSVYALATQTDGKVLVGGDFLRIGGQTALRLARLNSDGSRDESFNPSANLWVACLAVQQDGKIIVGGGFNSINGVSRNCIARLHPDGSLDTTFNPNVHSTVLAIALQPDGKIVIGGYFKNVSGSVRNHIARLHGNGTLDTSFNPNVNMDVNSIAIQADGKLVIGGMFTTVGGTNRNHIARLNPNGTLDTGFNPGAGDMVDCLAIQPDGRILVGGQFTSLGGQTRLRIARILPDGTLDASFNPTANGSVSSIALQSNGAIWIGGAFTTVGGMTRSRIACLDSSGSPKGDLNPSVSNFVNGLAIQPNGRVLVAGDFTSIGGQSRNRIARLFPDAPATQFLSVPRDGEIEWQRGGGAPELTQVRFELGITGGWLLMGHGERTPGGWRWNEGTNTPDLPWSGQIRALGFTSGGDNNGSSGLVEQIVNYDVTLSPPGLGDSVDAPHLTWTTGDSAKWTPQTAVTHDGVDAAASSPITANQSSWIGTTVTGPGILRFRMRVSSEEGFDHLRFTMSGEEYVRISGETPWQESTINVPVGTQTLRWTYSKDGSVNAGQDRSWLDQVSYDSTVNLSVSPPRPRCRKRGRPIQLHGNLQCVVVLEQTHRLDQQHGVVHTKWNPDLFLQPGSESRHLAQNRNHRIDIRFPDRDPHDHPGGCGAHDDTLPRERMGRLRGVDHGKCKPRDFVHPQPIHRTPNGFQRLCRHLRSNTRCQRECRNWAGPLREFFIL